MSISLITVVEGVSAVVGNEPFRKFMCGTYSDGTTRSLSDCIAGEILSPQDKAKQLYKKRKNKKNKKNKNSLKKLSNDWNRL